MPGRNYASDEYRFGFNSMEKDDELKGSGNSYDFGARIYDPRLGRWLSLDPAFQEYPGYSDYNFTLNNPILYVDPTGEWVEKNVTRYDKKGKIKPVWKFWVATKTKEISLTIHNAKLYNHDGLVNGQPPSAELMQNIASSMQQELLGTYGSHCNVQGPQGSGKTVSVSVQFAQDIEVVNDLKNVKSGFFKPDDLIVLTGDPGNFQPPGNWAADALKLDRNLMVVRVGLYSDGKADGDKTYTHEFTHQRTKEKKHYDGGAFFGQKPSFNNLWKLSRGGNRPYSGNPHYQKLKRENKRNSRDKKE